MLTDPGQQDRLNRGIPVVPVFDGYRAFAIFGIITMHVIGNVVLPLSVSDEYSRFITATFGQLIDVLFIVSGFVVFLPTAVRGHFGSVPRYAIRRAARLLPAYYLILAITVISLSLTPSLFEVLVHVVGLQTAMTYFQDANSPGFNVLGPVWTLSVEIGFYIVLPFVAMAFYRHPRIGLVIAAIISVGWVKLGGHADGILHLVGVDISPTMDNRFSRAVGTQFPFWAFSFALGMFGAKAYVYVTENFKPDVIRRRAEQVQLIGLAGVALLTVYIFFSLPDVPSLNDAELVRYSPLIMIGYSASLATLMVASAFGNERVQWFFGNRGIRWLAEISYGAYLSHALFIWVGYWYLGWGARNTFGNTLLFLTEILVASAIYGYLSARFFEQPIRRWARKFGRRT